MDRTVRIAVRAPRKTPKFSVLQRFLYARDAYGYLAEMQRKYGDPFTIPALNGTLAITGDPTYIQQIYSADPDTFATFGAKSIEPVVGRNSLLLLSGARHRRERKLLVPPFHGARMRAYGETIRAAALAGIAGWRAGQPFTMQTTTQWISLEVINRAVFGVQDAAKIEAFRAGIIELVAAAVRRACCSSRGCAGRGAGSARTTASCAHRPASTR